MRFALSTIRLINGGHVLLKCSSQCWRMNLRQSAKSGCFLGIASFPAIRLINANSGGCRRKIAARRFPLDLALVSSI